MEVRWAKIKQTDGKYEISTLGQVRSVKTGKMLRTPIGTYGYQHVTLLRKTYFVHRLVAEHFLPRIDGLDYVNHKDEDKTNPSLDNLEWCTIQYNSEYSNAKTYYFISPEGGGDKNIQHEQVL